MDLEPITEFLCERGAERSVAELIARLSSGSFYYAGLLFEAGGESFIRAFGEAISSNLKNSQRSSLNDDPSYALLGEEKAQHLLKLLSNDKATAEAFRFLWQRFLSCAVRAGLRDETSSLSDSTNRCSASVLGLLSGSARETIRQARVDFWQELWQSTVSNLLSSRSARGGDFTLSASFALASLCEIS